MIEASQEEPVKEPVHTIVTRGVSPGLYTYESSLNMVHDRRRQGRRCQYLASPDQFRMNSDAPRNRPWRATIDYIQAEAG